MEKAVLRLVSPRGFPYLEMILYPCFLELCVGTFFPDCIPKGVNGSVFVKYSVGPAITFLFVPVGFLSWWSTRNYVFQCLIVPKNNDFIPIINKGLIHIQKIFQVAGFLMPQILFKGDAHLKPLSKIQHFKLSSESHTSTSTFVKWLRYAYKLTFLPWAIPLRTTIIVGCLFRVAKRAVTFSQNSACELMLPSGRYLTVFTLQIINMIVF